MPNIQPLFGTLHLRPSVFFSPQVGTNPNLIVFDKSIMDMDTLHDGNEEPLLYFSLMEPFNLKIKLN
jgi:hypothetical protein